MASDNQMRIEICYLCLEYPYFAYFYFKVWASTSDSTCYGLATGTIVVFESY